MELIIIKKLLYFKHYISSNYTLFPEELIQLIFYTLIYKRFEWWNLDECNQIEDYIKKGGTELYMLIDYHLNHSYIKLFTNKISSAVYTCAILPLKKAKHKYVVIRDNNLQDTYNNRIDAESCCINQSIIYNQSFYTIVNLSLYTNISDLDFRTHVHIPIQTYKNGKEIK